MNLVKKALSKTGLCRTVEVAGILGKISEPEVLLHSIYSQWSIVEKSEHPNHPQSNIQNHERLKQFNQNINKSPISEGDGSVCVSAAFLIRLYSVSISAVQGIVWELFNSPYIHQLPILKVCPKKYWTHLDFSCTYNLYQNPSLAMLQRLNSFGLSDWKNLKFDVLNE